MLKSVTILALTCAAALPAVATAQDKPAKAVAKTDSAKPICRTIGETGSRLGGKRECHTQAEWDQLRVDNADAVRRSMGNSPR